MSGRVSPTGVDHNVMEPIAQTMTYTGGGGAVIAGLSLNQVGIVVGIIVGVSGLVLQLWLGMRRDRREQDLYRQRIESIKGKK